MPNQIALGEIAPGCAKVDPILVADNVSRTYSPLGIGRSSGRTGG